ncbi:tRNA A64-2'-O-ribosylphosphate transferase [Coniella lustricola]|uniref:tRNA A64-2'-O-ribosylphosphate transferase n=1 Tax=Coniella lustricola TaxID=2025994 RepID=A0A2T3AEZ2_9PEZI|nr:tRNA A64-2'-O-ribosylphosphate transferase [Coniella lustricola]
MTALSDIIFPSQASDAGTSNINRILGDLKRANLSITNRLRSIQHDADFVQEAAAAFGGRPLVANERCGSWYIRPEVKSGSAYFKSTDGHTGQWKFSTRRLNLHLLPLIEKCDGIIVVDSTRRGKRMPDALSKTIPIWCCVLNRALFPDQPEHHGLYVPPNAVSDSERSQALARIPEGLAAFKELSPDLESLRKQITKPLRPTWVTQETGLSSDFFQTDDDDDDDDDGDDTDQGAGASSPSSSSSSPNPPPIFTDFRPVICCTSSRRIADGEMSGHTGYIQGAGDDTENWAHGLEPPVFWAHADELLSTPEAELPDLIRSLVAAAKQLPYDAAAAAAALENNCDDGITTSNGNTATVLPSSVRQVTPGIYVSPLPIPQHLPLRQDNVDVEWLTVALLPAATPAETWTTTSTRPSTAAAPAAASTTAAQLPPKSPSRHLQVGLGKHKVASRNLRTALPAICESATVFLHETTHTTRISSETRATATASATNTTDHSSQPDDIENKTETITRNKKKNILIACDTGGKDLSIGVALAIHCWCFQDDEGNSVRNLSAKTASTLTSSAAQNPAQNQDQVEQIQQKHHHQQHQPPITFTKSVIKVRLGRIMTAMPDANPNRATLQSVNSFLMDWQR